MYAPMSGISPAERRLVVSLHDVHPGVHSLCEEFICDIKGVGVDRLSLLVVPYWKRESGEMLNDEFVGWLKELRAAGHELVLHGYNHMAAHRVKGLGSLLAHKVYTEDEAEFFGLDEGEARRRLSEGMRLFAEAGIRSRGFVAPAWLMSAASLRAIREAGFAYATTWSGIIDLRAMKTLWAPCATWSSRSAWRRAVSVAWVNLWMRLNNGAQTFRIAVHPKDLQYGGIRRSVLRLVALAARDRNVTVYDEIIGGRESGQ